jgi:glutamine amidotransferase
MIVVVDYGMANIASVLNMLRKVGASAVASADPVLLATADKIILPGIGAYDSAMQRLHDLRLFDVLNEMVQVRKVPTLGICLGMQLLLEGSEEGVLAGFGWIKGRARRFVFPPGQPLKIPHMGWSEVRVAKDSVLFRGAEGPQRFYFVHSYHVVCSDPADVLATAEYGHPFTAGVERGNVSGLQCHPEKSHRFGMRFLRAFSEQ